MNDRTPLVVKEASATTRPPTEITVRIISALVLIAVSLVMTLTSLETFGLMIASFTIAIAWEWGRLVRSGGVDLTFAVHAATMVVACWSAVIKCPACAIFAVLAGTIIVFFLRISRENRAQAWWSAAGVYYNGFPAIGLIWLRGDAEFGVLAVLYIFLIVWTMDSAAFLFGRWIGGPKLAPKISPKKTWAGFLGGIVSVAFASMVFGLAAGIVSVGLVLLAIGLAVITQFGDLGESAIKRNFDRKDSSTLIPGHGGVMDRLDGLIFAATAAAILSWALDPLDPGRTLLLWP
ncbi:MAG: phosphatidate cytidylyltransferase [Hyphomicrobiales bacterium]|nr:phosphatidate cytidylyltransferase [Hyphomicrobiales bacterium]